MMPPYFERKLTQLLPSLYRIEDESGDLQSFLNVTAPTLDELKELIDRFPQIFDVDVCEERWLPYLANLVGMPFDGTADPTAQRRLIKEAVPIYQRKATIPAIRRSLTDIGWSGELEETFRRALRLNSRPLLNGSKLPGLIHSLGVYRVICLNQTGGLRDALTFHHPAGTRAYFWQWFFSRVSHAEDLTALEKLMVRYILFGSIDETFALNRTPLGRCFHLTRKQKAFSYLQLNSGTTLWPDYDYASVCFASWHGRGDRMRLNRKALNSRMLTNCWESERKYGVCCEVQARRQPPERPVPMILNRSDLGAALLNHANIPCRVRFKQKDYYGESAPLGLDTAADGRTVRRSGDSRLSRWFRVNRSRVSGGDRLTGKFKASMFFSACFADSQWGEVTEAWDVVDRWRRHGPAFTLNANALNTRYLTDANLTEERASFELRVDTGAPRRRRTQPLRLNQRHLNHTGLRLSVNRSHPMRLGRMALNQSGPRLARPDLVWRFRQKDEQAPVSAGFDAAANHLRVTRWPA